MFKGLQDLCQKAGVSLKGSSVTLPILQTEDGQRASIKASEVQSFDSADEIISTAKDVKLDGREPVGTANVKLSKELSKGNAASLITHSGLYAPATAPKSGKKEPVVPESIANRNGAPELAAK